MVLEIRCVEPINPQYIGVLETCVALRYWFFEVLGSESVKSMSGVRYLNHDITNKWRHLIFLIETFIKSANFLKIEINKF